MTDYTKDTSQASSRKTRSSRRRQNQPRERPTLHNALDLFEAETTNDPAPSVHLVRLSDASTFLIPFTTGVALVESHFADFAAGGRDSSPSLRGYIRCNGDGCILCDVGNKPRTRHLLPVYDISEGSVGILAFSGNVRPKSLFAQLLPALKRVAGGEDGFLIEVRKDERAEFSVNQLELDADANDGDEVIARFRDGVENGDICIEDIVDGVSNDILAEVPQIARILSTRKRGS